MADVLDSLVDSVEDAPADSSARYGKLAVSSKPKNHTEYALRIEEHEAISQAFPGGVLPIIFCTEGENGEIEFVADHEKFPDCSTAQDASLYIAQTVGPIRKRYEPIIAYARTMK